MCWTLAGPPSGRRHDFGRIFDPIVDIAFHAAIFLSLHAWGYPELVLVSCWFAWPLAFGAVGISLFRGPVEIRPHRAGKTTGVVMTLLVGVLVAGAVGLPAASSGHRGADRARASVFVEAIRFRRCLIGWYNFGRRA
jgi:phosphatidylglycerophosphate synthase